MFKHDNRGYGLFQLKIYAQVFNDYFPEKATK